jgi:predicted metal-dependent hydrolase
VNPDGFDRGIQLFNDEAFFDAHEVWEDVWRETEGSEKKFLRGMIQVAVAFHHHATGNLAGARSVLERSRRTLAESPAHFAGINVRALLASLEDWQKALSSTRSKLPHPKITKT